MGSPSFGGFHARLDWSPVSLQAHVQQLKSNTANTPIVYIVSCSKIQNRSDEKYSLTGTTFNIHTIHDGVRATQRSCCSPSQLAQLIMAISGHRREANLGN